MFYMFMTHLNDSYGFSHQFLLGKSARFYVCSGLFSISSVCAKFYLASGNLEIHRSKKKCKLFLTSWADNIREIFGILFNAQCQLFTLSAFSYKCCKKIISHNCFFVDILCTQNHRNCFEKLLLFYSVNNIFRTSHDFSSLKLFVTLNYCSLLLVIKF